MGNAAIYYYPSSSSKLHAIDLGGPLSSLMDHPVRDQDSARAFSGSVSRVIFSAHQQVDVSLELIRDTALIADLEAFVAYMGAGGICAIVEDDDYVFGGYAHFLPDEGDKLIQLVDNQFRNFSSTPLSGTGDYLIVQGPSPRYHREKVAISTRSGTDVTLSTALLSDWRANEWMFVRDARFWPYLKVRPGAESSPMLRPSSGTRITYTLTLQLFEPPDAIERAADLPADAPWPGQDIDVGGDQVPIGGVGNYNDLDLNTSQGGIVLGWP